MDQQLYTELLQEIRPEKVIAHLKAMIAIKSENPFHENPRAGFRELEMVDYYADQMNKYGLTIERREVRPGRPNIFGYMRGSGSGKTLMLAGHLDTARTDGYADAYHVAQRDGKIFGRGACDMKAALAAYLEVVRLLHAADLKLPGTLILAGTMDEEFQMLGAQDIGQHGPHANQGIIGEPTDLLICPANRGRVSTYIRTFGKAAHSSVPEQGENAIMYMARVLDALASYNAELLQRPPHPLVGCGRFNPGVIRGGVQVNMVPDRCKLEIDRRTLPGETCEQVYQELRDRLDPLSESLPGFQYDITDPTWLIPANDVAPNEPVVQSLLAAYSHVFGQETQATGFAAGSDAPHFGFPTVICGPGSIAQAHTTNEYVVVDQLIKAVKMYLWVVLDLLGK